ncbi:MAG: cell division protein ZapA [Oscillospiraceae bacterium]|jgi:cell division protein ZapA (FtsZ GTPase activity inhibitor)|nr:cell division protein ZapA [Oscillospiraceae bacterium]
MPKRKVKVNICENQYVLLSDESEDYTLSLADEVSAKITETVNPLAGVNAFMAAFLTAIAFCDKAKKAEDLVLDLKERSRKCIEGETAAKSCAEKFKKAADELRGEIRELKNKIKILERN